MKDILKRFERDKASFKNYRGISRNNNEWHEANGVIDYIRQLINDVKKEKIGKQN